MKRKYIIFNRSSGYQYKGKRKKITLLKKVP
jgi:hypothetical protein